MHWDSANVLEFTGIEDEESSTVIIEDNVFYNNTNHFKGLIYIN